jgi:hypothetical protein
LGEQVLVLVLVLVLGAGREGEQGLQEVERVARVKGGHSCAAIAQQMVQAVVVMVGQPLLHVEGRQRSFTAPA